MDGFLTRNDRENLQLLDMVGVTALYENSPCKIVSVASRTKTQIKMSDGSRWMIETGHQIGSNHPWRRQYLITAELAQKRNAELEEQQRRNILLNKISTLRPHNLSTETLERIVTLLHGEDDPFIKQLADALNTEERGEALIQVARDAAAAERALAATIKARVDEEAQDEALSREGKTS